MPYGLYPEDPEDSLHLTADQARADLPAYTGGDATPFRGVGLQPPTQLALADTSDPLAGYDSNARRIIQESGGRYVPLQPQSQSRAAPAQMPQAPANDPLQGYDANARRIIQESGGRYVPLTDNGQGTTDSSKSPYMANLESQWLGNVAGMYGTAAHAGRALDIKGLQQWGEEGAAKTKKREEEVETPGFSDVWAGKPGTSWSDYGKGLAGAATEVVAEGIATALAGAALGSVVPGAGTVAGGTAGFVGGVANAIVRKGVFQRMFGKAIAAEATKIEEAAAKAGVTLAAGEAAEQAGQKVLKYAVIGATLSNGKNTAVEVGSIYNDARELEKKTGKPVDMAKVAGYGIGAGLVETIAEITGVARFFGVGKSGSRAVNAARGGLAQSMIEGSEEGTQTVLERIGAQQNSWSNVFTDPEARRDIIDSMAAGAGIGGIIGVGGGALHGKKGAAPDAQDAARRAAEQLDPNALPAVGAPPIVPGSRRGAGLTPPVEPPPSGTPPTDAGTPPTGGTPSAVDNITTALESVIDSIIPSAEARVTTGSHAPAGGTVTATGAPPAVTTPPTPTVTSTPPPAARTPEAISADLQKVVDQRNALLDANGKPPVQGSKKGQQWATLSQQFMGLMDELTAARKAAKAPAPITQAIEETPTTPEPPSDINAQVAAMLDPQNPKDAVFVAKGAAVPEGLPPSVLRVDREEGSYLTTNPAKQKAILKAGKKINDKTRAAFLGIPESKAEVVAQGGAPVGVSGRDAQGNIVAQAVTPPDLTSPNATAVAQQTPPDGTVTVQTPTEVVAERNANAAREGVNTVETPPEEMDRIAVRQAVHEALTGRNHMLPFEPDDLSEWLGEQQGRPFDPQKFENSPFVQILGSGTRSVLMTAMNRDSAGTLQALRDRIAVRSGKPQTPVANATADTAIATVSPAATEWLEEAPAATEAPKLNALGLPVGTTFVGSEKVTAADLKEGDWVIADGKGAQVKAVSTTPEGKVRLTLDHMTGVNTVEVKPTYKLTRKTVGPVEAIATKGTEAAPSASVVDLTQYRAESKAVRQEAESLIAEAKEAITTGQLTLKQIEASKGATPYESLRNLDKLLQTVRNKGREGAANESVAPTEPTRVEYPPVLKGDQPDVVEAKRWVVDAMNGDIPMDFMVERLRHSGLEEGTLMAITNRLGSDDRFTGAMQRSLGEPLKKEALGAAKAKVASKKLEKKAIAQKIESEQIENEQPIPDVLYHGGDTPNIRKEGFKNVAEDRGAFYFTPDAEEAKGFSEQNGVFEEPVAAKLTLKNPLKTTNPLTANHLTPARVAELKAAGYDGVVLYANGGVVEVAVFDPGQISIQKEVANAVSVGGTEEVLQRQPGETGKAGGGRKRVEPSKQREKTPRASKDTQATEPEAIGDPTQEVEGVDANGDVATLRLWTTAEGVQRAEVQFEDGGTVGVTVKSGDSVMKVLQRVAADKFFTEKSVAAQMDQDLEEEEGADVAVEEEGETEGKKPGKKESAAEHHKRIEAEKAKSQRKLRKGMQNLVLGGEDAGISADATPEQREAYVNGVMAPEFGTERSIAFVETPQKWRTVVSILEKLTGQRVQFFKPLNKDVDNATDGFKIKGDLTTVYVSTNVQRPEMFIMGHEIGHNIRANNPQLWAEFVGELKKIIDQKRFDKYLHKLKLSMEREAERAKRGKPNLKTVGAHAQEEVSSDALGTAFMDPEFWKLLSDAVNPETKPLVIRMMQEVAAMLQQMLRAVREYVGPGKKGNLTAEQQMFTDLKALNIMVRDLLLKYRTDLAAPPMTYPELVANARQFYEETMQPDPDEGHYHFDDLSDEAQEHWIESYDLYVHNYKVDLLKDFEKINDVERGKRTDEIKSGATERSAAYQQAETLWNEKFAEEEGDPQFSELSGDHKNEFIRARYNDEHNLPGPRPLETYEKIRKWRQTAAQSMTDEEQRTAALAAEQAAKKKAEEKAEAAEQRKRNAEKKRLTDIAKQAEEHEDEILDRLANLSPHYKSVVADHWRRSTYDEQVADRFRKVIEAAMVDPKTRVQKLPDDIKPVVRHVLGDAFGNIKFSRKQMDPAFLPTDVKSQPFLSWFRKSKVTDDNGEPLRLYHGTDQDVHELKMSKDGALGAGVYLTPDAEFASSYANRVGGNVLPVYASLQNPLILRHTAREEPMALALTMLGVEREKAEAIVEKAYEDKGYISTEVKNRAQKAGYDGIMQYRDGKLMEVVAWQRDHVKSAITNTGEYEGPGIAYSRKDTEDFWDADKDSDAQAFDDWEHNRKKLTETAPFKKWFKKSKVMVNADPYRPGADVDAPAVVWHHGSFTENGDYTPNGPMHFGSRKAAEERAFGKRVDDAVEQVGVYERTDPRTGIAQWFFTFGDGTSSEDRGYRPYDSHQEALDFGRQYAYEDQLLINENDTETTIEDLGSLTGVYLSIQNPKRMPDQGTNERWKLAIDAAIAEGYDGISYFNMVEDKGSISWIAFSPGQIKSIHNFGTFNGLDPDIRYSRKNMAAELNEPQTAEQERLMEEVAASTEFLTKAEIRKLKGPHATQEQINAVNLVESITVMPDPEEVAAIAWAGRAKRGWYVNSMKAIKRVFGIDSARFTALLAAMSPQTSVEQNLLNALRTWRDWNRAGRPTDYAAIEGVLGGAVSKSPIYKRPTDSLNKLAKKLGIDVSGMSRKQKIDTLTTFQEATTENGIRVDNASVLEAWLDNAVRALSAEHPSMDGMMLSGPKVDSFFRNLIGDMYEVTNDAWMAAYAMVDQDLFSGGLSTGKKMPLEPGKGPGYLAFNVVARRAARILTERTGYVWHPAEVQETVWSWAKTLYELQGVKEKGKPRDTRTALQLLDAGVLTDDLINATPDFRSLFTDEKLPYQGIFSEAGLQRSLKGLVSDNARDSDGSKAAAIERTENETPPFDRDTQLAHERSAAAGLSHVYATRLADKAAKLALKKSQLAAAVDAASVSYSRKDLLNPIEVYALHKGKVVGMATWNVPQQMWTVYKALNLNSDIRDDYTEQQVATVQEAHDLLRDRGVRLVRRKESPMMQGQHDVWARGPDALWDIDTSPLPSKNWFVRGTDRILAKTGLRGPEWRRNLDRAGADSYVDALAVMQDIVRKGGYIDADNNLYQKITLFSGATGEALEYFKRKYGEPLEAQIESAIRKGATIYDIETSLIAAHAEERNKRIATMTKGKVTDGSGMDTGFAKSAQTHYANTPYATELTEINRIADEISTFKVDLMEKSGLISPETATFLRQYDHYRPLKGLDEDDTLQLSGGLGIGTGFSGKGSLLKFAMGRDTRAQHTISHMLLDAEAKIVRAGKNVVGKALQKLAEDFPDPKFWRVNPMKARKIYNPKTGTIRYYHDNGVMNPNMVTVFNAGVPTRIELLNQEFAEAMTNAHAKGSGLAIQYMRKFNRFLAMMMTTLNPEWMFVNMLRDAQTTVFNLSSDSTRGVPNIGKQVMKELFALKGHRDIYKALTDPNHPAGLGTWYKELEQMGGITKFFGLDTLEDRARNLANIERRVAGKGVGNKINAAYHAVGAARIVKLLEDLNATVEAAPRVIVYKTLVQHGWSKEDAAEYVKNLTVNFNRKGTNQLASAGYLFFNPAVQGTKRLYHALKTPQGKALATSLFATGLIASIIGNGGGGDDDKNGIPDYQQLSDYERSTHIILWPKGPKIPIPYGWNAFYAAGNYMGDTFFKRPVMDALFNVIKAAHSAFNPVGSADAKSPMSWIAKTAAPTVLDPFLALALNENPFGGRIHREQNPQFGPVMPESQMGGTTTTRAARKTSELLNMIGGGTPSKAGWKYLDINPDDIDFLAGQFFPGVPTTVARAGSTAQKLASGEDTETREYPVVRRLWTEPSKGKVFEAVDDAKKEIGKLMNIDKHGTPQEKQELNREHPGWRGVAAIFSSTTMETGALQKRKAGIISGDVKVTDEAKEKNRINQRMLDLDNRMLKRYNDTASRWTSPP